MTSRTKQVTFTLTERQTELVYIALHNEICEYQDNPDKAWQNKSKDQDDRRAALKILHEVLPRGYHKTED